MRTASVSAASLSLRRASFANCFSLSHAVHAREAGSDAWCRCAGCRDAVVSARYGGVSRSTTRLAATSNTPRRVLRVSQPSRVHAVQDGAARDGLRRATPSRRLPPPYLGSLAPGSDAATERKPSPLEKGGTLAGAKALGIDASSATLAGKARAPAQRCFPKPCAHTFGQTGQTVATGKFMDARWVNGTWDLAQFKVASGETDWDSVIDAEARTACAAGQCSSWADPLRCRLCAAAPWSKCLSRRSWRTRSRRVALYTLPLNCASHAQSRAV